MSEAQMTTLEEIARTTYDEWRAKYIGLTLFAQQWDALRPAERILFIKLVAAGRDDAVA